MTHLTLKYTKKFLALALRLVDYAKTKRVDALHAEVHRCQRREAHNDECISLLYEDTAKAKNTIKACFIERDLLLGDNT